MHEAVGFEKAIDPGYWVHSAFVVMFFGRGNLFGHERPELPRINRKETCENRRKPFTFSYIADPYCFRELSGGERGIRTLDRTLRSYNGLANRRLQPLGHLSCLLPDSLPVESSR